jgi:hypothetical protein
LFIKATLLQTSVAIFLYKNFSKNAAKPQLKASATAAKTQSRLSPTPEKAR